jgi:hypothetical protein
MAFLTRRLCSDVTMTDFAHVGQPSEPILLKALEPQAHHLLTHPQLLSDRQDRLSLQRWTIHAHDEARDGEAPLTAQERTRRLLNLRAAAERFDAAYVSVVAHAGALLRPPAWHGVRFLQSEDG